MENSKEYCQECKYCKQVIYNPILHEYTICCPKTANRALSVEQVVYCKYKAKRRKK